MGFTEKSPFREVSLKANIKGGLLKKDAWTVCRFKGGAAWQERGAGVFEGGLIPQCAL